MLAGEVVSLASIVFLGKEGFKTIKSKVFAFVEAGVCGAPRQVRPEMERRLSSGTAARWPPTGGRLKGNVDWMRDTVWRCRRPIR